MLVDIPKDVQFATALYTPPEAARVSHYQPRTKGDPDAILAAVEALERAERPVIYSGGGVINAGPEASRLLRELTEATGFPITSTLMGLGAYPATGRAWLGMLGMHGTYQANWVMHDCDFMLCIGARFDDRITGRTDAFSPNSYKVQIDIDPSSINKNIHVQVPIVGDVGSVLADMLALWKERGSKTRSEAVGEVVAADRALARAGLPRLPELRQGHQAAIRAAAARGADPRATTATSAPRSASTRCGRRSTWTSTSRTAG